MLDADGNAIGSHDQDYIHNNKKLVISLDSTIRTLVLGGDLCFIEHIQFVYNSFRVDEHKLKHEDVDRTDKQNSGSAKWCCQEKVRQCLTKMYRGDGVPYERVQGTEMYLGICGDYVEVFTSPRLDPRGGLS